MSRKVLFAVSLVFLLFFFVFYLPELFEASEFVYGNFFNAGSVVLYLLMCIRFQAFTFHLHLQCFQRTFDLQLDYNYFGLRDLF